MKLLVIRLCELRFFFVCLSEIFRLGSMAVVTIIYQQRTLLSLLLPLPIGHRDAPH